MEKLNQEEVVVVAAAAKDVLELPPSAPANMAVLASIRPITPDSKRESGEFLFDFASSSSSPLSFISSSPPKDIIEHSTSTPKEEGVSFDPFATTTNGPPHKIILLALEHLECQHPSFGRGRRQLNFESPAKPANSCGSNAKSISEEEEDMLLETVVYETLLEAIVSKQTDESSLLLDEISVSPPPHQTSPPKTPPTCAPHPDGVAETCPDAPMKKCTTKSRNIDRGLCRKLEF